MRAERRSLRTASRTNQSKVVQKALSEQTHRLAASGNDGWGSSTPRPRKPASPFRYFNSSPEVIRLVVMLYIRFPLSLRNLEDLLFERGIDICYETVRMWWNRFGPVFAADIRRQRVSRMRGFRHRHWSWWKGAATMQGPIVQFLLGLQLGRPANL